MRECDLAACCWASARLADVGSLNGTYVNGQHVDRAELADGDAVWTGNFHLRFRVASQHKPIQGAPCQYDDRER
ncbi:FHA domain-containing protein [Saccharopolyspora pogona]|uniref:FHA domain-containing protein n=1 Tax=Saccharopolyspora pogona TaxID=333966 RepID=UPI001681C827|nr:FHA domain-containing protein [Saccharopolyspora pogona]